MPSADAPINTCKSRTASDCSPHVYVLMSTAEFTSNVVVVAGTVVVGAASVVGVVSTVVSVSSRTCCFNNAISDVSAEIWSS